MCSLLHSPATSSVLGPYILLSTHFSNTPAYVPPSWATMFHTHQNNRQNCSSVCTLIFTFV
jgi:hypothetical protein